MLKLLRQKKVAKRILYCLAAIIIPAFVIWGSASVMNKDRAPDVAGEIFGKKIGYEDFQKAVMAWRTQVRLQYGDEAEKIGALLNPVQGAWDRLILLQEARRRRLRISDQDVVSAIARFPFLQRNGQFDPQAYGLFLQYTLGLSAHQFEEQLRQNLAMAKIYDDETKNVSVTREEAREEYRKQNTQTRLRYVLFEPASYKDEVRLSEEELKNYYDAFREDLTVPPQINTAYVMVPYEEETSAEQKSQARKKMTTLAQKSRASGLKKAAQAAGLETKETGFFGLDDPIPTLGWMPQIKDVLFDTPKGSLTDVMETDRGIYLFEILEKKDAYIPDFKEAKDKVTTILTNKKTEEMALSKAQDFLSRVFVTQIEPPEEPKGRKQKKGKKPAERLPLSFDKAAQAMDMTVKETPPFSQTSYIPELGLETALKEAAFSLKKDEIYAQPILTTQGVLVIQSLEAPALDEIKMAEDMDVFQENFLEQKRVNTFSTFFEKLKKEARLKNYITQDTPKTGAADSPKGETS